MYWIKKKNGLLRDSNTPDRVTAEDANHYAINPIELKVLIYAGLLEPGVSIWGCFCKMCMHLENIGFLPVLWGS